MGPNYFPGHLSYNKHIQGWLGWHSGIFPRLPPLRPQFESRQGHYVDCVPRLRGFSLEYFSEVFLTNIKLKLSSLSFFRGVIG